jgi:hypothetical protein
MFKTDHNLWRTSKGDQYGSSSETGVCWVHWAAFASQAPHADGLSSPRWGRFFGYGRKKIPARKGCRFQCREAGDYVSDLAERRWTDRPQFSNPAAIRDLPDVVVRSLPDRSVMNSSAINRALCSTGIRGGGSVIEVGLPTTSSDTNSSRVSVFDFKTIVRIWPSTVIGA